MTSTAKTATPPDAAKHLAALKRANRTLETRRRAEAAAKTELVDAVKTANAAGVSYARIAQALGCSKQYAIQLAGGK